jgi:hypothetical protein
MASFSGFRAAIMIVSIRMDSFKYGPTFLLLQITEERRKGERITFLSDLSEK